MLAPQSGAFASVGERLVRSAELAVDHINEDGGIAGQDVELIDGDTEADPSTATEEANRLVSRENVDFLAGNNSSSVGLAVSDFADSNDIVYITGTSSTDITGSACSEYVFTNNWSPIMTANAAVSWIAGNMDSADIYGITSDYTAGPDPWAGVEEVGSNTDGVNVVGTSREPFGATDYSSSISSAVDSDANTLILILWGQDLNQAVTQLPDFGGSDAFDAVYAAWYSREGGSAAYGTDLPLYGLAPYYWDIDTNENEEFVSSYRDAYNEMPGSWGSIFYGGVNQLLRTAQEEESTNSEDVARALEGREYTSYNGGSGSFRACDHQILEDQFTLEVHSEEQENEIDYMNVVSRHSGAENAHECRDSCDLPGWE
jgi:branched-chain amino acid transport system substrate-binding protein